MVSNGTNNGFGSASTKYRIETGHYNGLPNKGSTLDIIPEDAPYTGGRRIFPITFSFNELCTVQDRKRLTDSDFSPAVHTDRNGNTWMIVRTSGRLDAYPIKDVMEFGSPDYAEHSAERMKGWLAMKPLIEYVERPARNGILVEGREEEVPYSRFSAMPDVKRSIKPYAVLDPEDVAREGKISINNAGRLFSQNANVEERIRDFLFINNLKERPNYDPASGDYTYVRESALSWVRHLLSKGIDMKREIEGIGTGDLSQIPAEAATIYRKFLVLANNLHQRACEIAEALGLKGKEAREFVAMYIKSDLEHEIYHFLEPDELSKRATEARAGELQSEHYSKQAKLREGTLDGRIYGILAKIYTAYAKTAGTGKLSKQSLSKLEALAKEYKAEAESSGMKGEDAAKYVESKLEAYAEKEIRGKENDSRETAEAGLEAKTAEADDGPTEGTESPEGTSE